MFSISFLTSSELAGLLEAKHALIFGVGASEVALNGQRLDSLMIPPSVQLHGR